MKFEAYIVGRTETVTISNSEGQKITKEAKVDTGIYSSKISTEIAKELKLPIVDTKNIKSSMGEEDRTFVELQFNVGGVEIKTQVGVTNMDGLKYDVCIGRKDLETLDALIDVNKKNIADNSVVDKTEEAPEVEAPEVTEYTEIDYQIPLDGFMESRTIKKYNDFK